MTQRGRFDIRAERRIWTDTIALYLGIRHDDGSVSVADNITFSRHEPGQLIGEDRLLSLHPEEAQLLIDELWRCGLRPTEGTGSAGSLAATERHLKDMQRIVFAALPSLTRVSVVEDGLEKL